jgi:hypothetical protein
MIKGKVSYVAPERLRGEKCDGRVDLFALGVVLWEMLVGQRLFRGQDAIETMHLVLQRPVPAPSFLRPEIPPALDDIVLRALQRDPADRYATGQVMADDLEEVLRATPYQSKALRSLVSDLFGGEMVSARRIAAGLPPEEGGEPMDNGHAQSKPPGQQATTRRPPGPRRPIGKFGSIATISATGAIAAMLALGALLFARAGGSQRGMLPAIGPARAMVGPVIEPIVNDQAQRFEGGNRLPARATNRPRADSDEGRITRGLSIDPFARPVASGGTP